MTESENNSTDINTTTEEPNFQDKINKIYLRKIAETINDRSRPYIKPDLYKKPFDPPAFRMALEFVSSYLVDKGLRLTLDLANFESNNLVKPDRHLEKYLAHNLRVEWEYPLIPQLIGIHKTKTHTGTIEGEIIAPVIPREMKLHKYVEQKNNPNDFIQSSDEWEFSTQSIIKEDIMNREKLKRKIERKKKERMYEPKHMYVVPDVSSNPNDNKSRLSLRKKYIDDYVIPNHPETFTELQTEDPSPKLWEPKYALNADKKKQLARKIRRDEERSIRRSMRSKKVVQESESTNYYGYTGYTDYYSDITEDQYSQVEILRQYKKHGNCHNKTNKKNNNYSEYSESSSSKKYVSRKAKELTERQKERQWTELGKSDSENLYELSKYNVAMMLNSKPVPPDVSYTDKSASKTSYVHQQMPINLKYSDQQMLPASADPNQRVGKYDFLSKLKNDKEYNQNGTTDILREYVNAEQNERYKQRSRMQVTVQNIIEEEDEYE